MQRFKPFSINLKGEVIEYRRHVVMGVINVTPDSFYAGSRAGGECAEASDIRARAADMAAAGADWIDIGGCSTRPGSEPPTAEEEADRIEQGIKAVRAGAPEVTISVDTYRADVATYAVEQLGADIINDVSAGRLDPDMASAIARLRVPYIATHMRGTPSTMQSLTDYPNGVVAGVISELTDALHVLTQAGVADIIVDPGFGLGKTVEQNYQLLSALPLIAKALGRPLLAGLSRKSMLYKPLGITANEALTATIAANTIAMAGGASVIRVHDVAEARTAATIIELTANQLSYNSIP